MVDMVTKPWVEQEGRLAESCEECFNCWLGGVLKSALCGERVELKVWSPVVLNLMVPTVFPLLNLLLEPVLLGLWWLHSFLLSWWMQVSCLIFPFEDQPWFSSGLCCINLALSSCGLLPPGGLHPPCHHTGFHLPSIND